MKKSFLFGLWMAALAAMVSAVRPASAADPEIAWREALRAVVSTNGLVVATSTNVVLVASTKTPAYVGQWLIGTVGVGTNGVSGGLVGGQTTLNVAESHR